MDSKQRSDNKRFRMYGKILYKPPHQRKKCKHLRGSALLTTPFKSNRYYFYCIGPGVAMRVLDQGGPCVCVLRNCHAVWEGHPPGWRAKSGARGMLTVWVSSCEFMPSQHSQVEMVRSTCHSNGTLMGLTCIGLGSKEKILNMLCRK